MRLLAIAIFSIFIFSASPVWSQEVSSRYFMASNRLDVNRDDHQNHMIASFWLSTSFYLGSRYYYKKSILWSSVIAVGGTLVVGALKETFDDEFDSGDMQANAVGAAAGLVIPLTFEF